MKVKSHSGAKKRVKKTGTGKLKVEKAGKRHLLAQKSKKQKRSFKRGYDAPSTLKGVIKKLLPNS